VSDLRRLASYLLRYRASLIGAVAAALFAAVFFGGAVAMVKPLMTAMVSAAAKGGAPIAVAEGRNAAPTPAAPAAATPAAPQGAPTPGAPSAPEAAAPAQAGPTGPAAAAPAQAAAPTAPEKTEPYEKLLPDWVGRARARIEEIVRPAKEWVLAKDYVRVPLVIIALYSLKALLFFFADYTFRKTGLRATAELRKELYEKSLVQSDMFFLKHSTGEMISRILGDVSRLQSILGSDIGQMLQSVPAAAVMLVVAFWQSWQVTSVCLVAIPLFALAAGRIGKRAKKAARRAQEQQAELVARIEESLIGRRVVQAYGAVEHEKERFADTIDRNLRQEKRVARATSGTPAAMEILGTLALMGLVLFASTMTRAGHLDPKSVFVALLSLGVVFTHVRRVGQLNTTVQQALAAARRIFEVLDEPVVVQDPPHPQPLPRFAREVRFENVSFDYGRGQVIHGVDLVVRAGEAHALVGPSGAGKSTLAMMLPRFIDPTAGRVSVDGIDLRDVLLADLRDQIALVSQETHLFDGTVRANIAYGRPDAPLEAVEAAAKAAHAHDFIEALPQGYDTPLGERGSQLSAGQRQRLAIARAFLKDAPILILDEATSALDSKSEREVQVALEALLDGRTALVIAHRLSTVARAHCIHVLDGGRIVESGPHAELLASGGAYARLHALQQT